MSLTASERTDHEKTNFKFLLSQIVEKQFCVGCGTCVAVCPFSALRMKETRNGYYVPVCDEEITCMSCKSCLNTCPAMYMAVPPRKDWSLPLMNFDINAPLLGSVIGAYIGYAKEQRVRTKGSSGGITSALLICALESGLIDGAIVVGMNKEQPWKPEVKIAKTREEILEAAGSKYAVVPVNSILKSVRKMSGKFALVGLPCHIRGLRMIQEEKSHGISNKICLRIGLFCGLNFRTTGTSFLLSKLGIRNLKAIQRLEYKHSYPGRFYVKLSDKELQVANASALLQLFRSEACTFCSDLTNELADISVGDIYSVHSKDAVGVILTRTKMGENILLKAVSNGCLDTHRTGINQVVESQFTGLIYKKNGSVVRKHLTDARRQRGSPRGGYHPQAFPTSRQLAFEIIQHKVFFEGINRFLAAIFEYLPFKFSTYAYGKIITLMFLLGKSFYQD